MEEAALQRLVSVFAATVHAHRRLGLLKDWLDYSGVEWYWREEHDMSIPVIDADSRDTPTLVNEVRIAQPVAA